VHESQLARRLVATLEEAVRSQGAKGVKSVKVRLGGVHWVDPDAFRELFGFFRKAQVARLRNWLLKKRRRRQSALNAAQFSHLTTITPSAHNVAQRKLKSSPNPTCKFWRCRW